MDLLLYIGQGLGLATAAGLRPFLPALVAGALASGDVLLDFDHTRYSFLESPWFLLAVVAALAAAMLAQRRLGPERFERGPIGAALAGAGIGLGALEFAAVLAQHHDTAWPGLAGGVAAAVLAQFAARPLLARTRARLGDGTAREAVVVMVDAVSLAIAALAVFAPPLSYIAVLFFARLALGGRRREGEKYAGLRILR